MRKLIMTGLLLSAAGSSAPVTVGQPAPDFSVTTVEGRTFAISELRGKRVLVFLWASW